MCGRDVAVRAIALVVMLASQPAWSGSKHGRAESHAIFAAGEPSKRSPKKVVVQVAMVEVDGKMIFAPNELKFAKGTDVRFAIRNDTGRSHEFVLGSHTENLGHSQTMTLDTARDHEEPNGRLVAAGAVVNLDWHFTKSGDFEFGCLLSGHSDVEVPGRIVVE